MTSPHRLIPLSDAASWRDALEGVPHSFWHRHEVCDAFAGSQRERTFLYAYDDRRARLVCPLAERSAGPHVDVYTPYGFSGFTGTLPPADFDTSWRTFASERGWICGYIALHPVLAEGTWSDAESSNSLYTLDLRVTPEALWSGLSRSRRRQLREWTTLRSTLVLERDVLARYFVDHYDEFVKRVSAPRAQRFSRDTLEKLCALDSVLMVGAGRPDAIEAVYLFGSTPHAGECLFNIATTESGREHATALLWWGVEELKQRGVPSLNMGGGLRGDDPIARAKQQFGSRRVPFRRLKQIYRQQTYDQLCRDAGVDVATEFFPAYRAATKTDRA